MSTKQSMVKQMLCLRLDLLTTAWQWLVDCDAGADKSFPGALLHPDSHQVVYPLHNLE